MNGRLDQEWPADFRAALRRRLSLPQLAVLLLVQCGTPSAAAAENLLANGSFVGGTAPWPAPAAALVSLDFSALNGNGPGSGSAVVGNNRYGDTTVAASSQCVATTAGTSYQLAAQFLFLAQPQVVGTCWVTVEWALSPGCLFFNYFNQLPGVNNFTGPTVGWVQQSQEITAPPGTFSARVTLRSNLDLTYPGALPLTCYFDEVTLALGPGLLFTDGFEP